MIPPKRRRSIGSWQLHAMLQGASVSSRRPMPPGTDRSADGSPNRDSRLSNLANVPAIDILDLDPGQSRFERRTPSRAVL